MKKLVSILLIFIISIIYFLPTNNVNAWTIADSPVSYGTFGTSVSNYGQLAVGSNGDVYVSGEFNVAGGINQLDSSGNHIRYFGPSSTTGVAIDPSGNVIVIDWDSDVGLAPGVYKFDANGNSIDISSTDLGGTAYLSFAYSAAVDSQGNVYISDWQGNGDADPVYKFNSSGAYVATIVGNGSSFDQITSIAVDASDNLYVLDGNNARVQKFDSSGNFVLQITGNGGAWSFPEGFTVDDSGNVYVSDSGNNRIQIFNSSGVFQQQLVPADFSLGSFSYLSGLAITDAGKLFVADSIRVLTANFDRSPATVTIDPLPGDSTTDTTTSITGTATDTLTAISTVEYSVDSGSYSACTADDGAFDELSEDFTCTISPALSLGNHTVAVRASDGSTNTNSGGTLPDYNFSVAAEPTPTPTATPTQAPQSNSNTSSSPGLPKAPTCESSKPGAPDLFQVDAKSNEAIVYYTPQSSDVNDYYISYGTEEFNMQYGTYTGYGASSGVLSFNIGYLSPTTTYYFKVRGQNGCMPGAWSNTISATTNSEGINSTSSSYKGVITSIFKQSGNAVSNVKSFIEDVAGDLKPSQPTTKAPAAPKTKTEPTQQPTPAPKKCFLWIFCF